MLLVCACAVDARFFCLLEDMEERLASLSKQSMQNASSLISVDKTSVYPPTFMPFLSVDGSLITTASSYIPAEQNFSMRVFPDILLNGKGSATPE